MRIRNILFPVDFSPSCVAMAPFVKRGALMFGAKVTLAYVVEPFSLSSGFELMVRSSPEVEQDRENAARAKLNRFLKSEFPLRESPRRLWVGDPATRIAEAAREHPFDVIVMPTHAGVFRRTLLGSTTAKVLNDANCPVFTTEHAEKLALRPLEHKQWVCAIGLQADSARVLRYASQAARTVHANLTLIHAIAVSEPGVPIQFDLEERLQSAERRAARHRIEELQKAVGSHARVTIAIGPIKDALTEGARRLQADVLVIGRSPQAGVRLRDLTYAVVRDAPCPVLSV
jgi:nucleotide-binding universal stress UspA family protein